VYGGGILGECEYRPYGRAHLRPIQGSICNILPSHPERAEAFRSRLSLGVPTTEFLLKCYPIFIDSSDESALISGLRVVVQALREGRDVLTCLVF
jgi:hypothetical protein